MTTSIASSETFYPWMLNNVQTMKPLFSGIKELHILENMPESAYIRPKGSLYLGRFRIVWYVVTLPFQLVIFLFLATVAWMFSCIRCSGLSRRITVISHHVLYPMEILSNHLQYGKRFIAPMLNDHRMDQTELFYLEDIPREKIKDPILRKKLHQKMDRVEYKDDGLCFGTVYWFNYLYLKACTSKIIIKKYDLHKDFARALATLFENGIPKQAALLQSTYGIEEDLLDVGHEERIISFKDLNSVEWIPTIANGVYRVVFPRHSISYIKIGKEQLVMDSFKGVIEIKKPKHLLDIIQEYIADYPNWPIRFDRMYLKNPSCQITGNLGLKSGEKKENVLSSFFAFLKRY